MGGGAGCRRGGSADLFLLTDADIVHHPRHLATLVAQAERADLDLVSEMVALACDTPAEHALVPAFVFFFQLLYPFAWVNDPLRATAAAAGGTILIRRRALAAHRRRGVGARRVDRRCRAGGCGEAGRSHLARPRRPGALGACLSHRGRHLAHGVAHRLCAVALLAAAAGRHRSGDGAHLPAAAVRGAVRSWAGALVRLVGLGRDGGSVSADVAPVPPFRAVGAVPAGDRGVLPRRDDRRGGEPSSRPRRLRGRVAPIRGPAHEQYRDRRGVVRQGSRRRELPGRLAADPPRPARARARVLRVRPQRRRHRGFPAPCCGRQGRAARRDGGRAAGPERGRFAERAAAARQPGRDRRYATPLARSADRVSARRDQAAVCGLGRAVRLLPLFGDAGRAARARPARRGLRDLRAVGRPVRVVAGAEPFAGLREGPGCPGSLLPAWRYRSRRCAVRRPRWNCGACSIACWTGSTR